MEKEKVDREKVEKRKGEKKEGGKREGEKREGYLFFETKRVIEKIRESKERKYQREKII